MTLSILNMQGIISDMVFGDLQKWVEAGLVMIVPWGIDKSRIRYLCTIIR